METEKCIMANVCHSPARDERRQVRQSMSFASAADTKAEDRLYALSDSAQVGTLCRV